VSEEVVAVSVVTGSASRLGYVHVGERHRGYLGSGSVDYAGFFRALTQVGYTGTVTFESFSSTVVSPVLSNMLAIWRNLWEDSGDLIRLARSFIDDQPRAVASIRHH
jgi:D-psicose/D-tagatose/L-ribulose 3-epimerase